MEMTFPRRASRPTGPLGVTALSTRFPAVRGRVGPGQCAGQRVSPTMANGTTTVFGRAEAGANTAVRREANDALGGSVMVEGRSGNVQMLSDVLDKDERATGVSRRTALLAVLSAAGALAVPAVTRPLSALAASDTRMGANGVLQPLSQAERAEVLAALDEIIPPSKAPLMLRLVFHDGATYRLASKDGGVNGSIQFELDRPENFGLKRGTNVIKQLQAKLPAYSFADLVVLAAAYAVKITNGPDMFSSLRVGRRDVTDADPEGRMPEETLSAEAQVDVFAAMGFSVTEMVALLGSHTIGQKGFGGPLEFDNVYYQSLLKRPWENKNDKMASMIGLASDRVLPDLGSTKAVIERFATDQAAFFQEFERAFIKLSELGYDM